MLREAVAAQGSGLTAGDEAAGAVLLVDETYRDLTHAGQLAMAATLSSRAVSVGSMSKAYGLPGLRIGWAVTGDPALREVRERLAVVQDWLDTQGIFEWIPPRGGVVGLVRFRPDVAVDTAAFYHRLLADHGTYVGPGRWFEVSDRYFRLGYGWPAAGELRDGLAGLTAAAEATLTAG